MLHKSKGREAKRTSSSPCHHQSTRDFPRKVDQSFLHLPRSWITVIRSFSIKLNNLLHRESGWEALNDCWEISSVSTLVRRVLWSRTSWEQACWFRRNDVCCNRVGTSTLTKDCDLCWISTKVGNVALNPLKCCDLILETVVAFHCSCCHPAEYS